MRYFRADTIIYKNKIQKILNFLAISFQKYHFKMTGCSLCGRNKKQGESLSMRCVPRDPETAKKWREKFPLFFSENMRVCEAHFRKVDFEKGRLKRIGELRALNCCKFTLYLVFLHHIAVPLTRNELLTYDPDEIGRPLPGEVIKNTKKDL
jgi:THAP domain